MAGVATLPSEQQICTAESGVQPTVIIVQIPQYQPPTQQHHEVTINQNAHKVFAIMEFIIAAILFSTEFIMAMMRHEFTLYYTGFWFPILVAATGLLGLQGALKNNSKWIIACMVMAIILCVVSFVALIMYAVEVGLANAFTSVLCEGCLVYLRFKNGLGILLSIVLLVLPIVQAACCCGDVCGCTCCRRCFQSCCWLSSRELHQPAPNVMYTNTTVQHQPYYPQQLQPAQLQPPSYAESAAAVLSTPPLTESVDKLK